MKKLIVLVTFISVSLAVGYRMYAGGGDSFAGGMAGGMFGGLLGGTIASSANRGSVDDGGSRRAINKIYDEIDRLRNAVRKDLEGLNNKLDKAIARITNLESKHNRMKAKIDKKKEKKKRKRENKAKKARAVND